MRNIRIILLLIIIALCGLAAYYWQNPLTPKLSINGHVFTYELAVTPQEHAQGLSGHKPLAETEGMLFVFDHKEQFKFWMKDMTFPLDIIWIDDKKIIDISKNVPQPTNGQTQLPMYTPKNAANRVFEINAGLADKLGIKEGDTVEYLRK